MTDFVCQDCLCFITGHAIEQAGAHRNEGIFCIAYLQVQTLFQSNKDLFYSLKNYLGKDSVIAIATKKEIKLNEENLTNFIDFHSLLAFELSKSWSPKYIVYDQEKGEIDIKDFK